MIKKHLVTYLFIVGCLTIICSLVYIFNQNESKAIGPNSLGFIKPPYNKYQLSWSDEFNKKTLDDNKWITIPRLPHYWRMNMSDDSRLYRFHNGYLRLYCMKNDWNPDDTCKVLTGGISTKGKFEIGYGKIEARIRLSNAMGCWPAFWLSSFSYGMDDPRRAEIDVFEYYNHDKFVHQAAHNHYIDYQKKQSKDIYSQTYNIDVRKWNIYGVEIQPDQLIFLINGRPTFVYNKINNDLIVGQYPYGQTKCVIRLSMQWSNPWLDKLRKVEELPAYMDIDWVRVYTQ